MGDHPLNVHTRDLATGGKINLLAHPAQSDFSSAQHPLGWIERAHVTGWDVLLHAAACVPIDQLDPWAVKPDSVPLSFYKMLGSPSALGALIARKIVLGKLRRPLFARGRSPSPLFRVKNTAWPKPLSPSRTGWWTIPTSPLLRSG